MRLCAGLRRWSTRGSVFHARAKTQRATTVILQRLRTDVGFSDRLEIHQIHSYTFAQQFLLPTYFQNSFLRFLEAYLA